ncbi:MAG: hypothetical protein HGA67_01875 [Candidatus Yonathbacteria bacterium]|nr:hypothetical protein [Candidatus Yonathbacteria bacterium]
MSIVKNAQQSKKDLWARIRKGVSLACVLIVAAVLADVLRFTGTLLALPTVGKANSVNDHPYSREIPSARTRILVLGDSTAVGVGAYIPQETIAGMLGADLPDADIQNKAVSGARIADVRVQLSGLSGPYDMILIQAGANDIVFMTDSAEVERQVALLMDEALVLSTHVVVATSIDISMIPLLPKVTSFFFADRSAVILPDIEKVVEERGGIFVNLYRSPEEQEFVSDPDKFFSADGFHPSSDGYRIAYSRIKSELKERGIFFDPAY